MDEETLVTRSNDFVKHLSHNSYVAYSHGNIGEAKAFYNEAMGAYMLAGLLITGPAPTHPTPRKLLPPDNYLEKLYEDNPPGYRDYVTEVSAVRWQENTGE